MILSLTSVIRAVCALAVFTSGCSSVAVVVPSRSTLPTPAAAAPTSGSLGYDVGYQSCASALPTGGSFGVIGTTAGQPYHPSLCLETEYTWASQLVARPQFYVNLANPGHKSSHWSEGGPKTCRKKPRYDLGCAFDYGYEAAAQAWASVRGVGSSGAGRWWLDVERDNSWGLTNAGIAANVADIRGALKYLRKRPGASVGIYTETFWWQDITADSRRFTKVPVWGGGAGSKRLAMSNCKPHSITGGPALLAQWIKGNKDHDIAC